MSRYQAYVYIARAEIRKQPQGTTRTAAVSTDNNNNTKSKNEIKCSGVGAFITGVEVVEIISLIT